MARDRKRHYNILLSPRVGQMLKDEALNRESSVSALVEELLCRALNVKPGQGSDTKDVSRHSRRRQSRRCRISLNDVIWGRLEAEAGRRGIAVVRVIRDLLSQSLFGPAEGTGEVTVITSSMKHEEGSGEPLTLELDLGGGEF